MNSCFEQGGHHIPSLTETTDALLRFATAMSRAGNTAFDTLHSTNFWRKKWEWKRRWESRWTIS